MMGKKGIPFLLIVLVGILYLPFLSNVFLSDDIQGIVLNLPQWTWQRALAWPKVIEIGWLGQFTIYSLFGMHPWAFRFVNILFHMGSVVLLWQLLRRRTNETVALVAALLFAVHPLVIESVTWISGGWYAWSGFFFLLSLISFIRWHDSRLWRWYVIAIVGYLCMLLLSEKTMALSALFLVYVFVYGKWKKEWVYAIPFFLLSVLMAVYLTTLIGTRIQTLEQATYTTAGGLHNPFIQLPVSIATYLTLFVWPSALTLYHSYFRVTTWQFVVYYLMVVAYLGVAMILTVRKKPMGFWLLWFCFALAPVLTPFKVNWLVAERYAYTAIIGLCVVVGMMFDTLLSFKRWKVVGICLFTGVMLALCARTIIRNNDWRTEERLWVATAIASPDNPQSWNNMGDVYGKRGEYEKSIEAFTEATKLKPNYADAYHNIGKTYVLMKKYDEAIPFFERALSINPNLWQSYRELAGIAVVKGMYRQAIGFFKQGIAINSRDATMWANLGQVYLQIGEETNARTAIQEALRLDPENPEIRSLQRTIPSDGL